MTSSHARPRRGAGYSDEPATRHADPETDPAVPRLHPELLTAEQRHAILELLLRGASRTAACRKVGVSLSAVTETAEADPAFRAMLREVQDALAHNVVVALYRGALEGSVTAQSAYLKFRLPSLFRDDLATTDSESLDDVYDKLDPEDFDQLCRSMDVSLSPEAQRALDSELDEELSGGVPI
ncbi:MAG: hypothetical protein WD066_07995 [Planctomycetaceae bacterium]